MGRVRMKRNKVDARVKIMNKMQRKEDSLTSQGAWVMFAKIQPVNAMV
jgi:hypothetical protein